MGAGVSDNVLRLPDALTVLGGVRVPVAEWLDVAILDSDAVALWLTVCV